MYNSSLVILVWLLEIGIMVFYLFVGARILHKSGENGWKILIPFYGIYLIYKVARSEQVFWESICVSVIAGILISITAGGLQGSIALISIAADIGLAWNFASNLANAFGKSKGFAVGLLLLSAIFFPILAFGSAQYQYGSTCSAQKKQLPDGDSEDGGAAVTREERDRTLRNSTGGYEQTTTLKGPEYRIRMRLICSGQYMDTSVRLQEGGKTVIGRGEQAQVRTNPADGSVSERHGIFSVRNGMVVYTDNSRNGTRYNGQRVLHAGETVTLPFNTKIQIEIGKHKVLMITDRV